MLELFAILFLFSFAGGSAIWGYMLAQYLHDKRNWKCLCDYNEECARQLEADTARYVLTEGPQDRSIQGIVIGKKPGPAT